MKRAIIVLLIVLLGVGVQAFAFKTGRTYNGKPTYNVDGIEYIVVTDADAATGKVIVKINPKFYRPAEVDLLLGNPEKAEKVLGWKREVSFPELVERMVENDMKLISAKK